MRLANSAARITSIARLLDGSREMRRQGGMVLLFRIAGHINGIFSEKRMNGANSGLADLSAIDVWAVTSTHELVPEDRTQKLSAGPASMHGGV